VPPLREVEGEHLSACHFAEELINVEAPLGAGATT
jgi:hypothetical protein